MASTEVPVIAKDLTMRLGFTNMGEVLFGRGL
jgi:hypothetical protein